MSKVNLGAGAPKSTWTKEKEEELKRHASGRRLDIRRGSELMKEKRGATETIVHMAEGEPIRYRGGIELRGGGLVRKRT